MAKLRTENVPFTQVANAIITDPQLSWKAKGLFAYMFSKPQGWNFSANRIANDSTEGRKSVLKGLQELEEQGYLHRIKKGDRTMEYSLKYSESPKGTLSESPNLSVPKSHSAQRGLLSNKESISNKEQKVILSDGPAIAEVINLFKDINPSYQDWFSNTTQRKAVAKLIDRHGIPKVHQAVRLLLKTNTEPYITAITTPHMLEAKWAIWEAQIRKKMAEKQTKGKQIISST